MSAILEHLLLPTPGAPHQKRWVFAPGDWYMQRIERRTLIRTLVFTGDDTVQGYWKGLGFDSTSSANRLSHVRVEYAGASGWTGDTESKASIFVSNAGSLSMSNVTVTQSGRHGLYLASNGTLTCSGATFTDNASSAVYLDATNTPVDGCP